MVFEISVHVHGIVQIYRNPVIYASLNERSCVVLFDIEQKVVNRIAGQICHMMAIRRYLSVF